MSSFENVPESVRKFGREIQEEYFPELEDCRYQILFDTRETKKPWLAKIYRANDLVRFLTIDEPDASNEGLDYIIVLDKLLYESDAITDADRKRLIRHEMRHIYYDPEKNTRKSQYKLVKHTINDFYEEVDLAIQEGDPRWVERVSAVQESLYDNDAD